MAGAILLGATSPARADTATSLAEERYAEGSAALDHGVFASARLSLVQAYAVDPQPRYLFTLALAEARGDHPVQALAHFRQFLKTRTATDEQRRTAAAWITDADGKTGHLRIIAPDGAFLTLDGTTDLGRAPIPDAVDVAPGPHRLDARTGDRQPDADASTTIASSEVNAAPGQTSVIRLLLPERPTATRPAQPPSPAASVEGVEGGGRIASPSGAARPLTDNGKPMAGPRWIVTAGLLATGLVSFAVAGGVSAAAGDQNNRWAQLDAQTSVCPQPPATAACTALKRAADRRATDENVATGFIVGGGALVAAAVLTLVFWPGDKSSPGTGALAPVIGPDLQGAAWVGSF